ncbi:FMN-binding protein [Anaerocolumna xylanovorans]|uniref:FMN-binding domain-containing protein n=1 Tax=Anaerocolumna xylanovorans DSM 12503 TaxID=1121345 RepID=A0A1M7XWI1_9FIRM|nr:FMN-binding protein [Anaerocolumna xylanovorans]SHO43008.1 FMN-binding domain-containing protein [Anaerocolumna xylanovorans DSM 12503]
MKKAGIVLFIIIIIVLGAYLWMAGSAKSELAAMVYENVDMNLVADGTYYGEADAGMVFVKVSVTVKDHSIEKIAIIEHKNGLGSKAEAITKDMIAGNSYHVDAVSGATFSSETIKSAVSKALKEGYNSGR